MSKVFICPYGNISVNIKEEDRVIKVEGLRGKLDPSTRINQKYRDTSERNNNFY